METIAKLRFKNIFEGAIPERFSRISGSKISEICWFSLCLFLFMALGPLSAPFAIFAAFNECKHSRLRSEPESLNQTF